MGQNMVRFFTFKQEKCFFLLGCDFFILECYLFSVFLERGYILDRQREGIAIAKLQGKYRGRKAKAVDEQLWGELYGKWVADEITAVEFMQRMGLSKSAFYRRVARI